MLQARPPRLPAAAAKRQANVSAVWSMPRLSHVLLLLLLLLPDSLEHSRSLSALTQQLDLSTHPIHKRIRNLERICSRSMSSSVSLGFVVKGMTCADCSFRLEEGLKALPE